VEDVRAGAGVAACGEDDRKDASPHPSRSKYWTKSSYWPALLE
jgi:hypothetical protein